MKRVINGKTYSKVLGIKQGSLLTAGKDGDIEEYKADPTDAGKVLTVGEDGGVAPAEGGGGGMYCHHVYIGSNSGNCLSAKIINSNSEAFTFDSFKSYIAANFAPSSISDLTKKLNCNGTIKVSSSVPNTDLVIAISAAYGSPNSFKYFGSSLSISDGKIASSITAGIVDWSLFTSSTFTDTVTTI